MKRSCSSVARSRLPVLPFAQLIAAALLAIAVTPASAALAGSDFATDADGWLGYACPNPGNCLGVGSANLAVTWNADGGAPAGGGAAQAANGYIETVDPGGSTAARVEPDPNKYAGLYALGRSLSFDVLVRSNGGGGVYDLDAFAAAPLVAIEAPGAILVYAASDLPVIDGDWKHYDVPLANGPNWFLASLAGVASPSDGQFAATLAAMTRLTLISEWLKEGGEVDTGAIDNFQVVPL
ncbi:MAG: hypothetical protein RKL32_03565, partial [Gammaproteobacteria bacterium]